MGVVEGRSFADVGVAVLGGPVLTPEAEALYRRLVHEGAAPRAGAPATAVEVLLALGLARVTEEGLTAMPPRLALESLAGRQRAQAVATEETASRLAALWSDRGPASRFVEALDTTEATMQVFEQLQHAATQEVCGLWVDVDRPRDGRRVVPIAASPGFTAAAARGVRYRVVYPSGAVADDAIHAAIRSCAALGEEVRLHPDLPMKLLIADRDNAVITVTGQGGQLRQGLAVRPSGLLDALVHLFESYWQQSQPLPVDTPGAGGGSSDESRHLLGLLAAGLTDESIAREVGVSERTVGRRVARLQQQLNVTSRFQLGVQASRRGWL